ncbi:sulfatase family protein [Allorhodopirellula solitaria]|uniref:Arylsulfatase n=1 Tax=Allorhodopirellula solitaria TaxID=2527987 RepID=A0A5C5YEG7_9BACT|nr:sulfatase-like hydrolase/transferase [Allorhodopirellula solitaria]TWT73223.1 Arylsulfatase precursor [Allorhodopirellula solitaria]
MSVTMRAFAFLAILCLSTNLQSSAAEQTQSALPNIVLCMADDQGWGDVGYYGKSVAKTPVLDEMASEGLRLDRFYSAAPVCSPTRGSVMTGRNPNRFGCFEWGNSLRPQEVTIAEALKQAGYTTGHFGKWHLGSVNADSDVSPGASGFDEWFSSPNFYDLDPLMSHNGRVVSTSGEGSEVTARAAIDFIRSCTQEEQPFLAVIWFGSPHSPHVALEKDRQLYADLPKAAQHYYGEITAMDRSVGMLRHELRELNVDDNTLFWYTSDNGPQGPKNRSRPGSSGGLRDRKSTLYEGGIRVPAIIQWPARIPQHRVSSVPANTSDIYPTLIDIAGVEIAAQPEPLDGISLLPWIDGQTSSVRPKPMGFWANFASGQSMKSTRLLEVLGEQQSSGAKAQKLINDEADRHSRINDQLDEFAQRGLIGNAAWIDNRYKLHRRWNKKKDDFRYELYDLEADVAEAHDLASDMPDRVAAMKEQLEGWQESVVRSLKGEDYHETSAP